MSDREDGGAAKAVSKEAPVPAGKPFRTLFRALFLVLLFLPPAFYLILILAKGPAERRLAETLATDFGRPVRVEGFRWGWPLRAARIEVGGDGVIDTGAIILLEGLAARPNLSGILSGEEFFEELIIDSTVIVVKYEENRGFSSEGLFPRPPGEYPAIARTVFRRARLFVSGGDFQAAYDLSGILTNGSRGAFLMNLASPTARLHVERGEGVTKAGLAVRVEMESVPHAGFIKNLTIALTGTTDTPIQSFALDALLHDQPFHLAATSRFEDSVVIAGDWKYGTGGGRIEGWYDTVRRKFFLNGSGNLSTEAHELSQGSKGAVDWRMLRVSGDLDGPWDAEADVTARGLTFAGVREVTGVDGALKLSAQLAWRERLLLEKLGYLRGVLAFDRAEGGGVSASDGLLELEGSGRAVRLKGRVKTLGGTARSDGVTLFLTPDFRLAGAGSGAVVLENIPLSALRPYVGNRVDEFLTYSREWRLNGKFEAAAQNVNRFPPAEIAFDGKLTTRDFAFSEGAARREYPATLSLAGRYSTGSGEGRVATAELDIENGKTRLAAENFLLSRKLPDVTIRARRLDISHVRDFLLAQRGDLAAMKKLDVNGGLEGAIQIMPPHAATESASYYLEMKGKLALRGKPLELSLEGAVTSEEPRLIFRFDRFDPQSAFDSLLDVSDGGEASRNYLKMTGDASATLTVLGSSWEDLNLEGILGLRNATMRFPQKDVEARGVTGEIPFRLRRAARWELIKMTDEHSREIAVKGFSYQGLTLTDLRARTRFDEKTLYIDKGTFNFAGGKGTGAFTIDFPGWDRPRFAFIGQASGFDVSAFYSMMPFQGELSGKGRGRIELMTDEGFELDLRSLKADLQIEKGVIGAELLKEFVLGGQGGGGEKPSESQSAPKKFSAYDVNEGSTKQSLVNEALLELVRWQFDTAAISVSLTPGYYSPYTAMAKFGRTVTAEIVGNYSISGKIRPLQRFQVLSEKVRPFDFFAVGVNIIVENAQMRLLMERVGRHTGATLPEGGL